MRVLLLDECNTVRVNAKMAKLYQRKYGLDIKEGDILDLVKYRCDERILDGIEEYAKFKFRIATVDSGTVFKVSGQYIEWDTFEFEYIETYKPEEWITAT